MLTRAARLLALVLLASACKQAPPRAEATSNADTVTTVTASSDSLAAIPDSVWIDVQGPTMIGFYPQPRNSDDLVGGGGALAHLLDQFTFNLGMATDSLAALGFNVTDRAGDTLWLRGPRKKWRFIRDADSALAGFYVASPDGRNAVRYGTEFSVIEHAIAFLGSVRAPLP